MTEIHESVRDLRDTTGYLADLTNQADTFDFELATDLRDEALRVQAAAKEFVAMLETTMLRELEAGSRERGGRVWARVRKYVTRHDHSLLGRKVQAAAIEAYKDPATGHVNVDAAVAEAVRLMKDLYVSPSTDAKIKPAKALGLQPSEYMHDEFQKYGLEIVQLDQAAKR